MQPWLGSVPTLSPTISGNAPPRRNGVSRLVWIGAVVAWQIASCLNSVDPWEWEGAPALLSSPTQMLIQWFPHTIDILWATAELLCESLVNSFFRSTIHLNWQNVIQVITHKVFPIISSLNVQLKSNKTRGNAVLIGRKNVPLEALSTNLTLRQKSAQYRQESSKWSQATRNASYYTHKAHILPFISFNFPYFMLSIVHEGRVCVVLRTIETSTVAAANFLHISVAAKHLSKLYYVLYCTMCIAFHSRRNIMGRC